MKQILIILLILVRSSVLAEDIRPSILDLVKKIEAVNSVHSDKVGISARKSIQYETFEKLRDSASKEELISLLEYDNSVVKSYAAWALADKKFANIKDIFSKFLESGETSSFHTGCRMSLASLADQLYYYLNNQLNDRGTNPFYDNTLTPSDSLFFKSQIEQLDSLILYSYNDSDLLYLALENNKANPKNYKRIKEIAEKKPYDDALVALALYGKKEDIPFFISQGKESFEAISYFPDKGFWDFLLSFKSTERSLDYFIALASFRDTSALEVLYEIYPSCTLEQISKLDEALIKNYCPLYQDLILKIWEEKKTIDYTVTQKLISDCPEMASESFAKGLLSDEKINLIEIDYNYGTDRLIIPLMLQTIANYDSKQLIPICNKNVLASDYWMLKSFLDCIESNHLSQTADNLLTNLRANTSKYDIFHISKTLLSFKNPETDKRVREILQLSKSYWDNGNWSVSIHELLDQHGIAIE